MPLWLPPGILAASGGAAVNSIQVSNDVYSIANGDSITFSPIANDRATDGSTLSLVSVSAPGAGEGSRTVSGNNLSYTAPASGTRTVVLTYQVSSPTLGTATGNITFNVGTVWYQANWVNGKAPLSLRKWNVGVFAVGGAGLNTYKNWCGNTPEIIAANCTGQQTGVWLADSWAKVVGGTNDASDAVDQLSQPNLQYHGQARDWIRAESRRIAGQETYGVTKRTWLAFLFTMVPFGSELSVCQAVANGTHDAKITAMGRRTRKVIDDAGQDYRMVIGRPNWEFNQDTGLRILNRTGNFGGRNGFYAAGGSWQLYADMCGRFFNKFWDGYGYRMPMTLSPAQDSTTCPDPNQTGGQTIENWAIAEYDLICCSFHPITTRVPDLTAARNVVYSTTSALYTPQMVINAARTKGRKVAFLEHAVSTGQVEWYTGAGLANVAAAYGHFGDICNAAAEEALMAFTCLLGTPMCNPAFLSARGEPDATRWRNLCVAYHDDFGKVGYPVQAS